jgi:hypothetical protein
MFSSGELLPVNEVSVSVTPTKRRNNPVHVPTSIVDDFDEPASRAACLAERWRVVLAKL